MSAPTAVLDGTVAEQWPVWTTTARVVVTDPAAIDAARAGVEDLLDRVDRAASRFRADSKVARIAAAPAAAGGHPVSPLLAELVDTALVAAAETDGSVDPTLGTVLSELGYPADGRDHSGASGHPGTAGHPGTDGGRDPAPALTPRVRLRRRADWRDVVLDGCRLTVPPGTLLDLGATAKAWAADRAAVDLAARLGCGVMVSLGGDLRVAGPDPLDGWQVLVRDAPGEPASTVTLRGARAVATSSTLHRRWRRDGRLLHHVLDPATGSPAPALWRTASVAAATCVAANTLTTAALVRGRGAPALLAGAGVPARLVAADGAVTRFGGWPA